MNTIEQVGKILGKMNDNCIVRIETVLFESNKSTEEKKIYKDNNTYYLSELIKENDTVLFADVLREVAEDIIVSILAQAIENKSSIVIE